MLNGLSLFSGIGGIDVALSEYVNPVAYCEIEPYCQSVLLQRMQEGLLPTAPIWGDIRTFPVQRFIRDIGIIYGGFPCQDISIAGKGKGLEGERSGLFFEIMRLAKEIKPRFIFLENVPAITSRGGLRVVREITDLGYDCRWCIISAASVGAMHRRKRWFLLAHALDNGKPTSERGRSSRERPISREGQEEQTESFGETKRTSGVSSDVANDCNTNIITSKQTNKSTEPKYDKRGSWREHPGLYRPFESREHWQKVVSTVCRSSDGVSGQVDRLKALGNAVVPQQVRKAFMILMGI